MAKKRKKKNKAKKIFLFFVFVIIVIGAALVVVPRLGKVEETRLELDKIEVAFNKLLDDDIDENIDFGSITSELFTLVWSTSKESVIDKTGKVYWPTFLSGNDKVTITLDCEVKSEGIDGLVFNFLGVSGSTFSKEVKVLCMPMSDDEKVDLLYNELNLPETIYASMSLPSSFTTYEGITINWSSSNENVLKNTGEMVSTGEVTLKATVSKGTYQKEKEFKINCLNELVIEEFNYSFDDYNDNSYGETSYKKVTLINSLNENGSVKFKVVMVVDISLLIVKSIMLKR